MKYFIFFYLFCIVASGCQKSNDLENNLSGLATLQTFPASNITDSSAVVGGTITNTGGLPIISKGVCWDTIVNPTIAGNHTNNGIDTGQFSGTIKGLVQNKLYHIRAYATNSAGTSYGSDLVFSTLSKPIGGSLYIGSTDGKLYAINAISGVINWSFQTGGVINSSPTVVGNLVVFGSTDRTLYAVNRSTGLLYWKYYTGQFLNGGGNFDVTPTVDQNIIYASCANGKIYAIDTTTETISGITIPKQKWITVNGPGSSSAPVITNNMLFSGGADKTVSAFNKQTGTRIWQYTLEDLSNFSNSVSVNNVLYVFAQNTSVYAINQTNGNLIWKTTTSPGFGGTAYSSPTLWNNTLYVGSPNLGALTNQICAIDINNGAIKWHSAAPAESGLILQGVCISNGSLFGCSNKGIVYAWDATSGAFKWKYDTGKGIMSTSPTVSNNIIYFAAQDGTVYALDATNGTLKWQNKITTGTDKIIISSPCIVDQNGVIHHPGDSGEKQ